MVIARDATHARKKREGGEMRRGGAYQLSVDRVSGLIIESNSADPLINENRLKRTQLIRESVSSPDT